MSSSVSSYESGIKYDSDNVFKKIIAGTIPSYKIFEDDNVIAILDAFPSVDGHSLLISKVEKSCIMDFTQAEAATYLSYIPKLSQIVQQATGATGVNVINNNGYDAGQRVFHVHYHIIPRFKDDGFTTLKPSDSMISADTANAHLKKMLSLL